MLKNICFVLLLVLVSASLALAQGAAPAPPFAGWWDARWSGLKNNDSVTDQTAQMNAAVDKACQLGRPLYIPSGTYNAGLTLDSTNDNLVIYCGDSVRIKQVWHLTGNGPDLDVGDPNYNATQTGFVENVTLKGTVILGSGGRIGTFYARNVKIENIIGEDSCIGVHIYSHSEDVSIDKIYIKGTKLDAGITGGVWIDKYTGAPAVASMPKNINIGSIHVVRAHYNGVFINHCKDIRIGDIRVDTAGLNGLRITGNASERISIGSVSVNKCGANTTNSEAEYIHSGISIDGDCSRITIQSAVVRNSWERGLVVTNGVRGLDIGTLVCDSNAINDSGISHSVLIESGTTENISLKRAVIKTARVTDSSYGLTIQAAKNVTVGDLAVRGGFRIGCLVTSTADNINIGSSHFVLDSIGLQVGSARDGHYNFESIMVDSCRSYGMFLTGLNDSSSVSIGSFVAQGDISEAFRSGIYMSNADGAVSIARAHIRGYDTTNARGFQVANNNDGKIRIDHLIVENCATGIYWDTVANDGFSFGVIDLKGNTNDYSTGAQRLLADRDIHFGVVDDTGRFGRFPYVNTTPSDNFIWKFDAADSTWKLEADAGAAGGDDVKADTTTAAGGVVDLVNPVLQEGSNMTFTIVGSDTLRLSSSGGTDGNDTLWAVLGNRDTLVFVANRAANDTIVKLINSGALTYISASRNTGFEFMDSVSMGTSIFRTLYIDPPAGAAITVGLTSGDRMYYKLNVPDSVIPPIYLVKTTIGDSLTARLPIPLTVPLGGTGLTTATDGGILLGSGTGAVTPMAVLGNGALVVGDGTTDPTTLSMGTASQQLRVNAGATALEWATISGTADGSGVWDSLTTGDRHSDVSLRSQTTATDTILRITSGSNITTLATDLTVPRSLVISSNGGVTINGGSIINKFVDSSEITNAADNGAGQLLQQWGAVDSARVRYPRVGGNTVEGMVAKYDTVNSTTAADSMRYAIPVESSADIAAGAVDITTDITGVVPPANGGTGTAMTNGQLLIGDGSGVPTISAISNGTGTTVTNGAGTIAINSTLGTSVDLASEITGLLPIANITAGTDQQVLKMSGTTVTWGTDATGGGGSTQFIKTVDTNSAGTTTIAPDSIHVNDSGGIDIAGKTVAGEDTLTFSIADGGVTSAKILNSTVAIADMVATFPYVLGAFNGYSTYPTWNGGTSATHPTFIRPRGGLTGTFVTVGGTVDTAYIIANTDNTTIDTLAGEGKMQVKDAGVSLTTKVSGILPAANGGSGVASPTANNVLLGNGTSAFQVVAPSTNGNVLTSNGTTWTSAAPAGGGVSKGRISVWDATELDDSGAVTTGSGIGSTLNLTPSPNTINLWVDPDGTTMDTAGGKVKVKDAGITATQLGTSAVVGGTGGDVQDATIDSFDIATGTIAGTDVAYRYVEYPLDRVHFRNQVITDSLTLSMPPFGSNTGTFSDSMGMFTLFIDSSSQGVDQDFVGVSGKVYEDMLADSLRIAYRTCQNDAGTSTATVAKINSVAWYYRTSSTDYTQQTLTAVGSDATDRSSATWTTASYALSGAVISAGTVFRVVVTDSLGGAQSSVHVSDIALCGRKR